MTMVSCFACSAPGRHSMSLANNGVGNGSGATSRDGAEHWAEVDHKEAVVLLNDATFDDGIQQSQDVVLVFFYAPWCIHCANVKQHYANAAYELATANGFSGRMAAVDISTNPHLERRFRLDFIPAFKLLHEGKPVSDHNKLRSKEDFVKLIKGKMKKNS